MGRRARRKGQAVHGVVLVDKPAGLTSRDVSERCRRAWDAQKAGHTGTLDPMATGLLVVCLGDATRFVPYLTGLDKAYDATMRLGIATTTDDAEGEPLGEPAEVTPEHAARAVAALERMRGTFAQVPPRVSAIKVDGRRGYDRARSGEEFELEARDVTVDTLHVGPVEGASIAFHAAVSKGTFIRSMARDAGAAAGCGGHLTSLRRTRVGALSVDGATTLEALEGDESARASALVHAWDALAHVPAFEVDDDAVRRLTTGQRPHLPLVHEIGALLRVRAASDGAFVGLAVVEQGDRGLRLRAERLNPTG